MARKKKDKSNYFDGKLNNIDYVEQIDNIVVDLFNENPIDLADITNAFWWQTNIKGGDINLYMALVFNRFKAKVKSKYKVKIKLDFENERVYIDDEYKIDKIKEKLNENNIN